MQTESGDILEVDIMLVISIVVAFATSKFNLSADLGRIQSFNIQHNFPSFHHQPSKTKQSTRSIKLPIMIYSYYYITL